MPIEIRYEPTSQAFAEALSGVSVARQREIAQAQAQGVNRSIAQREKERALREQAEIGDALQRQAQMQAQAQAPENEIRQLIQQPQFEAAQYTQQTLNKLRGVRKQMQTAYQAALPGGSISQQQAIAALRKLAQEQQTILAFPENPPPPTARETIARTLGITDPNDSSLEGLFITKSGDIQFTPQMAANLAEQKEIDKRKHEKELMIAQVEREDELATRKQEIAEAKEQRKVVIDSVREIAREKLKERQRIREETEEEIKQAQEFLDSAEKPEEQKIYRDRITELRDGMPDRIAEAEQDIDGLFGKIGAPADLGDDYYNTDEEAKEEEQRKAAAAAQEAAENQMGVTTSRDFADRSATMLGTAGGIEAPPKYSPDAQFVGEGGHINLAEPGRPDGTTTPEPTPAPAPAPTPTAPKAEKPAPAKPPPDPQAKLKAQRDYLKKQVAISGAPKKQTEFFKQKLESVERDIKDEKTDTTKKAAFVFIRDIPQMDEPTKAIRARLVEEIERRNKDRSTAIGRGRGENERALLKAEARLEALDGDLRTNELTADIGILETAIDRENIKTTPNERKLDGLQKALAHAQALLPQVEKFNAKRIKEITGRGTPAGVGFPRGQDRAAVGGATHLRGLNQRDIEELRDQEKQLAEKEGEPTDLLTKLSDDRKAEVLRAVNEGTYDFLLDAAQRALEAEGRSRDVDPRLVRQRERRKKELEAQPPRTTSQAPRDVAPKKEKLLERLKREADELDASAKRKQRENIRFAENEVKAAESTIKQAEQAVRQAKDRNERALAEEELEAARSWLTKKKQDLERLNLKQR